eukprot:scaffold31018_cov63-Phaeocystis_antarctica.AAC.20
MRVASAAVRCIVITGPSSPHPGVDTGAYATPLVAYTGRGARHTDGRDRGGYMGLSKAYQGATRKSRKQYCRKRKNKKKGKRKGKGNRDRDRAETKTPRASAFVARRMLSVGPAGSVNIHTDQGTWRQHCTSRNMLTNGTRNVNVRKKKRCTIVCHGELVTPAAGYLGVYPTALTTGAPNGSYRLDD